MWIETFDKPLHMYNEESYSSVWMMFMNNTINMINFVEKSYGFVNIGIIFLLSINQKKIHRTTRLVSCAYFFVYVMYFILADMNETLMKRDVNCYLYGQYIINLVLYIYYTKLYGWNIRVLFTFIVSFFTFNPICVQTFGLSLYAHEEEVKKDLKQMSNEYWHVEYFIYSMKLYNGSSFLSSRHYDFFLDKYESSQDHSLVKLLCISLGYMTLMSIIKPNGFDYNQIIGFTWLISRYLIPDHDASNIVIVLFCLYNFIIKYFGNRSLSILFILVSIQLYWNEKPNYEYCQTKLDYLLHFVWILPFEVNSLMYQLNKNNRPFEMCTS